MEVRREDSGSRHSLRTRLVPLVVAAAGLLAFAFAPKTNHSSPGQWLQFRGDRALTGRSSLKGPDEVQQMFLDNQPDGRGLEGLFATHPPIGKRIEALVKFGGGRDPGPWAGSSAAGQGTSVPAAG